MPSLNLDLNFFDHRKTRRLVALLGKGAELYPLKLWAYCGKFHAEDGLFVGYSPNEIEAIAGWDKEPGTMLEAMLKVEFMEMSADHRWHKMHGWEEHQGHIIAFKKRGETAAKARWGRVGDATSIAKHKIKQCPDGADGADGTSRANGTDETDVGREASAKSVAVATPAAKKSMLGDGDWLAELKADPAFEGIDVTREHLRMLRWCKDHKKSPTRRRFGAWLLRCDRPTHGTNKKADHSKGF